MKVLVIVDMQNDFIDGSLGTDEAKAIVPNVVRKIEQSTGDLILFTKDTHSSDYLETQEGRNLPIEHCIEETNGWMINDDVRNAWLRNIKTVIDSNIKDNTICKNTFGSKDLVKHLEKLEANINEIEFVGLCTDVCVISNAILVKAFLPEVKITVDASCCAGVTPESHNIALDAMRACQINVIY